MVVLVCAAGVVAGRWWVAALGRPSAQWVQEALARRGITAASPFVMDRRYLRGRLGPERGSDVVVVAGNDVWFDTLAILRGGEVRFVHRLEALGPGSGVARIEARQLLNTPYPQLVLVHRAGSTGTRYWRDETYLYVFSYVPGVGFREVFKHALRSEWRTSDGARQLQEYSYRFQGGAQGPGATIVVTDEETGETSAYRWDGCEYTAAAVVDALAHLRSLCLPLRHIASFSAFQGTFEVRGGAVYVYADVHEEAELDPEWFRARHPSWRGQGVRVARWRWDEAERRFIPAGESFADRFPPHAPDLWELADTEDLLALDVTGEPWRGLVPSSVRVKARARADVDGDGIEEAVLLWADPGEEGLLSRFFPGVIPKTLAVLERAGEGFVLSGLLYGVGDDYIFSRMDVQDLTGDGLPEVLVWGYSPGGSGGSAVLDVFAKDLGQGYVEGE